MDDLPFCVFFYGKRFHATARLKETTVELGEAWSSNWFRSHRIVWTGGNFAQNHPFVTQFVPPNGLENTNDRSRSAGPYFKRTFANRLEIWSRTLGSSCWPKGQFARFDIVGLLLVCAFHVNAKQMSRHTHTTDRSRSVHLNRLQIYPLLVKRDDPYRLAVLGNHLLSMDRMEPFLAASSGIAGGAITGHREQAGFAKRNAKWLIWRMSLASK